VPPSDYVAQSMGGDPFWGRRRTMGVMWGLGPPAYLCAVAATHQMVEQPSVAPLAVFCM
jgi:hypothetical protein